MAGATTAIWCCSHCGAIYRQDFPRCPADGAALVLSDRDPLVGASVGHYVIDELVGEGGMGRVYSARHATEPGKKYAIKVLLGDRAATVSMRKRFAREAKSVSRLDHPNIVRLIDSGQMPSGLPYIVMDLVVGRPLLDLITAPMAPLRVVKIAREICHAIAHAHANGVIHRDLKPENILITTDENGDEAPHITDFGLAVTDAREEQRLTTTGMVVGTPAYSAPEQVIGRAVDHRADLYALGMTMFEMLTGGRLPFEGEGVEITSAKVQREAPPLHVAAPDVHVPPHLEDVVAKLLARQPDDRFSDAQEVIAELDVLVVELAAGTQGGLPAKRRRRRRWQPLLRTWKRAVLLTSVGIALGGIAGIVHNVTDRGPSNTPEVVVAPATSLAPLAAGPAAAPQQPPAAAPPSEPPPPPIRAVVTRPAKKHPPRPSRPAAADIEPATVPSPSPQRVQLHATVSDVDVTGALPAADVQRAAARSLAALERCTATEPQTVVVRFRVGETRRAKNVEASGGSAGMNTCVRDAIRSVRTETAPDVGEVDVSLRVTYAVAR